MKDSVSVADKIIKKFMKDKTFEWYFNKQAKRTSILRKEYEVKVLGDGELPVYKANEPCRGISETGERVKKLKNKNGIVVVPLFEVAGNPEIPLGYLKGLTDDQIKLFIWARVVEGMNRIMEIENYLYRKMDKYEGKGHMVIYSGLNFLRADDPGKAFGFSLFEAIGVAKIK